MTSSLSNFVNNFIEGIHKIKCKYEHDNRKCDTCGIKCKNCECFLEYTNCKYNLVKYKCLYCNKNDQKMFDEKFKKQIFNTYKFFNHDFNKFVLLSWEEVYSYRYIDDCENFNETTLPEKEDFYSHLNMGDITDAESTHGKKGL